MTSPTQNFPDQPSPRATDQDQQAPPLSFVFSDKQHRLEELKSQAIARLPELSQVAQKLVKDIPILWAKAPPEMTGLDRAQGESLSAKEVANELLQLKKEMDTVATPCWRYSHEITSALRSEARDISQLALQLQVLFHEAPKAAGDIARFFSSGTYNQEQAREARDLYFRGAFYASTADFSKEVTVIPEQVPILMMRAVKLVELVPGPWPNSNRWNAEKLEAQFNAFMEGKIIAATPQSQENVKLQVPKKLGDVVQHIIKRRVPGQAIAISTSISEELRDLTIPRETHSFLDEIVSNSCFELQKVSGTRTEAPALHIAAGLHANTLIMMVSDNAGGMPKDIIDQINGDPQSFQGGVTTKGDFGSGKGLADVVAGLLQLQGRLQVSGNEHGSMFTLELPIESPSPT